MNFSRKTLNSSESSQLLIDPRQVTFVTLNGFWPLSKKPLTLLSPHVRNEQYQAGWNANQD